jgi:hypothetical protein
MSGQSINLLLKPARDEFGNSQGDTSCSEVNEYSVITRRNKGRIAAFLRTDQTLDQPSPLTTSSNLHYRLAVASPSATKLRKRSIAETSLGDDPDSDESDDFVIPIETAASESFRVNDREGVKKFIHFRLGQLNGMILKGIVHRWMKLQPRWRGRYQVNGNPQNPPPTWPKGVSFNGVHHLRKEGM